MSSPNHSTPAHPDTGYGHEEKQGRGWLRSKIKINYSSKKRDSVHAPADDDSLPKPKTSKLKKPFKTLRRKEGSKQTIDFSSVSQSDSQASGGDDASQSASSGSSEQLGIPPDPAATEPLSWTEIAPESLTRGMKDKDVKRQEMIYELIQTERGFIRFLTILRVLFRQRVELEGVVTPEESSTLFCNVDDVLAMNAQLCERLLSAKQQSPTPRIERVGPMLRECFEALDPHVYAVFCANQRRAVALFQQKMKSSPEFARVLDRVHSNPHCARLKFPDFVAKVFQRLSKYPLLLSGIEKYAPKGSSFKSERHDVHAAILRSKHILEVVDDRIRQEMDWERVLDLQHNLDFSACTSELKHLRRLDLTAHPRQIMREGSLDIVIDSQNNVKEVYVIVLTDLILFTQRRDGHFLLKCPGRNITNEGAKSPVLRLRDAHARAEAAAKDGFLLLNKTDACIYQLRAMSKKKEWIETITMLASKASKSGPQPLFREAESQPPSRDQTPSSSHSTAHSSHAASFRRATMHVLSPPPHVRRPGSPSTRSVSLNSIAPPPHPPASHSAHDGDGGDGGDQLKGVAGAGTGHGGEELGGKSQITEHQPTKIGKDRTAEQRKPAEQAAHHISSDSHQDGTRDGADGGDDDASSGRFDNVSTPSSGPGAVESAVSSASRPASHRSPRSSMTTSLKKTKRRKYMHRTILLRHTGFAVDGEAFGVTLSPAAAVLPDVKSDISAGFHIDDVTDPSVAFASGLRRGDVLLKIDHESVAGNSLQEVYEALGDHRGIESILVARKASTRLSSSSSITSPSYSKHRRLTFSSSHTRVTLHTPEDVADAFESPSSNPMWMPDLPSRSNSSDAGVPQLVFDEREEELQREHANGDNTNTAVPAAATAVYGGGFDTAADVHGDATGHDEVESEGGGGGDGGGIQRHRSYDSDVDDVDVEQLLDTPDTRLTEGSTAIAAPEPPSSPTASTTTAAGQALAPAVVGDVDGPEEVGDGVNGAQSGTREQDVTGAQAERDGDVKSEEKITVPHVQPEAEAAEEEEKEDQEEGEVKEGAPVAVDVDECDDEALFASLQDHDTKKYSTGAEQAQHELFHEAASPSRGEDEYASTTPVYTDDESEEDEEEGMDDWNEDHLGFIYDAPPQSTPSNPLLVVLDIGATEIRIGFASEEEPRNVLPSILARPLLLHTDDRNSSLFQSLLDDKVTPWVSHGQAHAVNSSVIYGTSPARASLEQILHLSPRTRCITSPPPSSTSRRRQSLGQPVQMRRGTRDGAHGGDGEGDGEGGGGAVHKKRASMLLTGDSFDHFAMPPPQLQLDDDDGDDDYEDADDKVDAADGGDGAHDGDDDEQQTHAGGHDESHDRDGDQHTEAEEQENAAVEHEEGEQPEQADALSVDNGHSTAHISEAGQAAVRSSSPPTLAPAPPSAEDSVSPTEQTPSTHDAEQTNSRTRTRTRSSTTSSRRRRQRQQSSNDGDSPLHVWQTADAPGQRQREVLITSPLEATQSRDLTGILALSFPLRERDVHGLFKDWRGIRILVETAVASLVPSNSHCSFLVLDHVVGSISSVLASRYMFADLLFSLAATNVVGVTFADQAFLSSLGSERRCALVVHVGETYTQVVPVVRSSEGAASLPEPLLYAAETSTRAGGYVTTVLEDELRYQAQVFEECTEEPFDSYKTRVIVDDIKQQCCFVSVDYQGDLQSCGQSAALEETYTLPNGSTLALGAERFRCYEPLFQSDDAAALPAIVKRCLDRAPAQFQEELAANIVLSGGTTHAQNFKRRLFMELQCLGVASHVDIVRTEDHQLLPWFGGGIVASQVDTMSQHLISRNDFEQALNDDHRGGMARLLLLPKRSPHTSPRLRRRVSSSVFSSLLEQPALFNMDLVNINGRAHITSSEPVNLRLKTTQSALEEVRQQLQHLQAVEEDLMHEVLNLSADTDQGLALAQPTARADDTTGARIAAEAVGVDTSLDGDKGKERQEPQEKQKAHPDIDAEVAPTASTVEKPPPPSSQLTATATAQAQPQSDKGGVALWTNSDVCKWLQGNGLGLLVPFTKRHQLDGKQLLSLTPQQLANLGMRDVSFACVAVRKIDRLRESTVN